MHGHHRSRRSRARLALVPALLLLVLTACTSQPDETSAGTTSQPTEESPSEASSEATEESEPSADPSSSTSTSSSGSAESSTGLALGVLDDLSIDIRLESVDIERFEIDDDEEEFTLFCFTADVQEVLEPGAFALQGFPDDQVAIAVSAELFEDDTSCVLVGFESGSDVPQYSIGVVGGGAVAEVNGDTNLPGVSPLVGSLAASGGGRTAAPDLINVEVDDTLDRIRYQFDEELDPDSARPELLAQKTSSGEITTAESDVTIENDTVVVSFADGADVEEGTRFQALAGAVTDVQGLPSTPGFVGDATAAPDLVSATPSADIGTQYDFTFDEEVVEGDVAQFVVYTANGDAFAAQDINRPSAEVIRANFPEVEDFADSIVLAAVSPGGVQAIDEGSTDNTLGTAAIAGPGGGGVGTTAGPDLIGAALDPGAGQATLTFDEAIDSDTDPLADQIYVVTESGEVTAATGLVETSGPDVTVIFDESQVEAAAAVIIGPGVVVDEQGDTNPIGSLLAS